MSYKIQYGQPSTFEKWHNRQSSAKLKIIFSAIILFISLLFLRKLGENTLQNMFIPRDAEITSAAFDEMTDSIRNGAGIKEAFTDFCLEIIENARIS